VLLPRLDTIFAPVEEDPARERPYASLDWRLVSPRESDWSKYEDMVARHATRYDVRYRMQRVENVAEWVQGRRVVVPQYHLWLYRGEEIAAEIDELYAESDPDARRRLWGELLTWQTSPGRHRRRSRERSEGAVPSPERPHENPETEAT
jgi:hypothetical protein